MKKFVEFLYGEVKLACLLSRYVFIQRGEEILINCLSDNKLLGMHNFNRIAMCVYVNKSSPSCRFCPFFVSGSRDMIINRA